MRAKRIEVKVKNKVFAFFSGNVDDVLEYSTSFGVLTVAWIGANGEPYRLDIYAPGSWNSVVVTA